MTYTMYKGHRLTEREANALERKLYYDFAYDHKRDIDDYFFMVDRGYLPESLIRRATIPGMPAEVREPRLCLA